jgi:hypothetical protein
MSRPDDEISAPLCRKVSLMRIVIIVLGKVELELILTGNYTQDLLKEVM